MKKRYFLGLSIAMFISLTQAFPNKGAKDLGLHCEKENVFFVTTVYQKSS